MSRMGLEWLKTTMGGHVSHQAIGADMPQELKQYENSPHRGGPWLMRQGMRRRLALLDMPSDKTVEALRITGSKYLLAELRVTDGDDHEEAVDELNKIGFRASGKWPNIHWEIAPRMYQGKSYLRLYLIPQVA